MLVQGHFGPGSGPILLFLTSDSDSSSRNTEYMYPQIQSDHSFTHLAPINAAIPSQIPMVYNQIICGKWSCEPHVGGDAHHDQRRELLIANVKMERR